MKKIYVVGLTAFYLMMIPSCTPSNSSASEKNAAEGTKPNVIFLIGDGMGLSQVSAAYYFGEEQPSFSRFQYIGLVNTSSATHKVTDSGAGGTALSTGTRTYNGAIGVDLDTASLINIAELLSQKAYRTGVVSTSSITHATPASFYAHVPKRYQEEDIALQLLQSGIDFFAGGGIHYFNNRKDGVNYLDSASSYGFSIDTVQLAADLEEGKKHGFLLASKALPSFIDGRGDFLPEATKLAIDYLSGGNESFFLMVEGSQIDWAGHANHTDFMVGEMLDFDKTIAVALDFAEKHGNTLVVVTADHETGGFTLSSQEDGMTADSKYVNVSEGIKPTFATGGHSATLVPVFAYGPGAEHFVGVYDNTDIFHKIKEIAK